MVNERAVRQYLDDADKLDESDLRVGDMWEVLLDDHVCAWLADQYTIRNLRG